MIEAICDFKSSGRSDFSAVVSALAPASASALPATMVFDVGVSGGSGILPVDMNYPPSVVVV
jgi:hypothetical protein